MLRRMSKRPLSLKEKSLSLGRIDHGDKFNPGSLCQAFQASNGGFVVLEMLRACAVIFFAGCKQLFFRAVEAASSKN